MLTFKNNNLNNYSIFFCYYIPESETVYSQAQAERAQLKNKDKSASVFERFASLI